MPSTPPRPREHGHPLPSREREGTLTALLITCLVALAGCDSAPDSPPAWAEPLPKVRNIRPELPYEPAKTVLHTRRSYLPLEADLAQVWQLVGREGLEEELIDKWKANGVRIGTMDFAHASRFMETMPGGFGVIQQSQAVSDDPLVLEITPWTQRKFELGFTPSTGSSETLNMPAGQTRLILDFQITTEGATLRLVPQHHWYEVSIEARSPQQKMLDGKLFADLAMAAKLTPEQVLVLAYEPPPKPKKPEKEPAGVDGANSPAPVVGTDAVTLPPPLIPELPPAPPAATDAIAGPEKPALPTLGTLMLTGERAGRKLQIVVILYVPPQGESKAPTPEIRPVTEPQP